MNELALFAGAGGGILGGRILGWDPVCAVELDPYCRRVLLARQRDGFLPRFPIWDDVRTFDGRPWRGRVDVVSGGFPCQDISSAGVARPRRGVDGERSGLWFEFERIVGEVDPEWVFIENSHLLRVRGLDRVLEGLSGLGFDAEWGVLGANTAGAPHRRERLWIVAHSHDSGHRRGRVDAQVAGAPSPSGARAIPRGAPWWPVDLAARVDDGVAHRMDRVRTTGNGQVPRVAALAWRILSARFECDRDRLCSRERLGKPSRP